jgi:hypothetical protein
MQNFRLYLDILVIFFILVEKLCVSGKPMWPCTCPVDFSVFLFLTLFACVCQMNVSVHVFKETYTQGRHDLYEREEDFLRPK